MPADPISPAEHAATCAPLARAATLPPRCYVDPAFYEREVERCFRAEWIPVAREDQLAEPGDYLAFELLGEPLVAVRGDDRGLRVLSRVCRHRWMPVVEEGRGRRRSFQCPYHLWTYGLDGRLVGAPDMDRAEGFERARCRLPAVAVECWEGWVFVNLDGRAAPLAPRLEGLRRILAPWGPSAFATGEPLRFEHDWNWKVMVENFCESYHHQGTHRDTFQPLVPASGTWAEDADGPWVALHNPTGDGSPLPTMFPVTAGAPRAEFLVGAVFPLLLFSVQPDGMVWYRLEPLAVDRFRLAIHPCLPPAALADPAQAKGVEGLRAFLDAIHRQDIGACEGVQRGLRSRLAEPGRLSHLEKGIWQLARWVLERTGAAA